MPCEGHPPDSPLKRIIHNTLWMRVAAAVGSRMAMK